MFPPDKFDSYSPASSTAHIPAISAILSSSDQYLAQSQSKEEQPEPSNLYSTLAEIEGRSIDQEASMDPLQYLKEPTISIGDVGNVLRLKVTKKNLMDEKSLTFNLLYSSPLVWKPILLFHLLLRLNVLNYHPKGRRGR